MQLLKFLMAVITVSFFAPSVFAQNVKTKPLSRQDIQEALLGQGMEQKQVNSVVAAIAEIEARQGTTLEVNGMLQASYFNGSFFLDKDTIHFDTVLKDATNNRLVKIPKLVAARYTNHGFKIELGYKWVLVFMTNGLSLKALNSANCGPGLALGLPVLALAGLEAGFMPCKNVPGSAIVVSPIVGIMGSITFPHLQFKVNEVAP